MPRYELVVPGTPDRPGINPFTRQSIVIKGRPREHHFWEAELAGAVLRCCSGNMSGSPLRWSRTYSDAKRAREAFDAAVAAYVGAGYVLEGDAVVLRSPAPPPDAMAKLLAPWEARLRQAPDDDQIYVECGLALGGARAQIARLYTEREASHVPPNSAEEAIVAEHRDELLGALGAWAAAAAERSLDVTWHLGFARRARLSDQGSDAAGATLADAVYSALRNPVGRFLRELTIGLNLVYGRAEYGTVIAALAAAAPPALESIHIGDFEFPDDLEISWARIGDCSPMWSLPSLRRVILQGGEIKLGVVDAPLLESLEIRTGGLGESSVRAIAHLNAPRLRSLKVWFGDRHYGAQAQPDDLAPLLASERLPELRELGIMNAELTDEICEPLLGSRLLPQLEVLDLSLGTLTDHGAAVLARGAAKLRHLRRLDVSGNLLSGEGIATLSGLDNVHVGEQRPDERYVAVGE